MNEAERLWNRGFVDLIPLEGKAPIIEAWTTFQATLDNAKEWDRSKRNVGLRAAQFPGIDCDVTNERLSLQIRQIARETFGTSCPIRIGRAPKWLLVTRLAVGEQPLAKRRIAFTKGEEIYTLEVLGGKQQYVVRGIHPDTGRPYDWETGGILQPLWDMKADTIPSVTEKLIDTFFTALTAKLQAEGWTIDSVKGADTTVVNPVSLYAPSLDLLQKAVAVIPNPENASRDVWVGMAHAVRGAMRPEWEDALGLAIFSEWAQRWPGGGSEKDDAQLWDTLSEVRNTGWGNIRKLAENCGWDGSAAAQIEAQADFPAVTDDVTEDTGLIFESTLNESVVADYVISNTHFFASSARDWFVWDGVRWCPDGRDDGMTREQIRKQLKVLIEELSAKYPQPSKQLTAHFRRLSSATYVATILKHASMDSRTFLAREKVNSVKTKYLFCIPEGIIDLRTGAVGKHDPALLITDVAGTHLGTGTPFEWLNFLRSSCGGDLELVAYIRSLLSSALTADMQSRLLWFLTGPSGAGKSTLLKHIHQVLGSYAGVIPDGALIRGEQQAHATAIASWRDKRFLHGCEIDRGHRWNVALLKSITGNEPIAARRLYREYEEFRVVGKVVIAGNETPTLPNVDSAVRARLRIIPFVGPEQSDPDLDHKLEAEYPKILAWLVSGAREWIENGYPPCKAVDNLTETYFADEDLVVRFRDQYFIVTGGDGPFVATHIIEQLWNRFTVPEQRRDYSLRSAHTLVKALLATDPKRLFRHQRRVDGTQCRGIMGMSLREEVDTSVEDLL